MEAKERRAREFALVVLGGIGLFAAVVGAHDGFVAYEAGSRFGGLLLLLAGSVLIAAAVTLAIASFEWAPTAGFFAAAFGVMIGVSFFAAELFSPDRSWGPAMTCAAIGASMLLVGACFHWRPRSVFIASVLFLFVAYVVFSFEDYDERLVIWASFVIFSVIAAWLLWRAKRPRVSLSAPRLFAGIFGFFSLSALIGGAQFWYTSQYLPANQGASLSIESQLRQVGRTGRSDIVELKLTVENTSQAKAEILGSVYRVGGSAMRSVSRVNAEMAEWLGRPDVRSATLTRYRRGPSWDLVQVGRIFADGWWLDPEERFSRSFLIYVPHGRYDSLRSQAEVLFAKGSALILNDHKRRRKAEVISDGHVKAVVTTWPIRETSWFRDLTRGNREVSLLWVLESDEQSHLVRFPHLRETVQRIGEEVSPAEFQAYNDQANRLYGLAGTVSIREIPLDLSR